ncbi:MAG: hypothetical protein IRY91_09380 [Gemmatimonadaceae bacterium]|nr:hypothetical protein [Gemmatimonadaceae bacterium]
MNLGFSTTALVILVALALGFAALAMALTRSGHRRWVWPAWLVACLGVAASAALGVVHAIRTGGPSFASWLLAVAVVLAPSSLLATAVPYWLAARARRAGIPLLLGLAIVGFLVLLPAGAFLASLVTSVDMIYAVQ